MIARPRAPAFATIAIGLWFAADIATFVYLTFFDGYVYTWWNWLFVVPINFMFGTVWPIYWLIIRPIFG